MDLRAAGKQVMCRIRDICKGKKNKKGGFLFLEQSVETRLHPLYC